MNIRPIRTEADHRAALARVESLMDAEPDTPEGEELDVLTTLIEVYEQAHHAIGAAEPLVAIQHAMEARGYTQSDLAELIGSRSRASEILSGTRDIPKSAMWLLHTKWRIPAESLIRPKDDA